MIGQQSYIKCIRTGLEVGLCLRQFPSELVEKDNKPYIQLAGYKLHINPLIPRPIVLARSKKERFLIEPSINACRISFTMKKSDIMDQLIAEKLSKMLASRAERFDIVRRKPMQIYNQAIKETESYDISLLVETHHLETYDKSKLINVIIEQISTLERDLSEIKLNINTECRVAATYFIRELTEGN